MWEEKIRIYNAPKVPNIFPKHVAQHKQKGIT